MLDSDWATRRDSHGRLWAGKIVPDWGYTTPPKASEPSAAVSVVLGLLLGLFLGWLLFL